LKDHGENAGEAMLRDPVQRGLLFGEDAGCESGVLPLEDPYGGPDAAVGVAVRRHESKFRSELPASSSIRLRPAWVEASGLPLARRLGVVVDRARGGAPVVYEAWPGYRRRWATDRP
jgi:hypothetical protein